VLVLMAGLPGSGKSTLALAVGRHLGWPVLDKDTVKSTLLSIDAEEELAAKASYVLLDELARDFMVGQGLSVVLDTPASYEVVFETTQQIAEDAGGSLLVVLCEAPRAIRAERLQSRERRPSHVVAIDDEAEVVIEARFEQLPPGTLRVSTEGAPDALVQKIVSVLEAPD
jgi:predicted kinase